MAITVFATFVRLGYEGVVPMRVAISQTGHEREVSAAQAVPSSPRGTILVVDDENCVRCSLKQVFHSEYRVLVAENAYQALALIRQFKVHVAILDVRMPGMLGTELLARLKEIEPAIQVVMLSASETVEFIRDSLRLGACDYITKPFEVAALRMSVERAMLRRLLADEVRANEIELRRLRACVEHERMQAELARQRGEIYASVIHDLNNPLTVIAGVVEILNRDMETLAVEDKSRFDSLADHLDTIQMQVRNSSQLSRRYLGFLRRGAMGGRVQVNQALQDVQMLLKNNRVAFRNQLVIRPLPEETFAPINGTDLIQCLINLVTNAFQSGKPPVAVSLSAEILSGRQARVPVTSGPVDVVVGSEDWIPGQTCLCISIMDDGPGIPSAIIAKVFEPYYTTKRAGEGSGLGLAIVCRLIREAGGMVHLHSEEGVGTKFDIYLPMETHSNGPEPA